MRQCGQVRIQFWSSALGRAQRPRRNAAFHGRRGRPLLLQCGVDQARTRAADPGRLRHGLVHVVEPSSLRKAVQGALQADAPVVRVFFEASALHDVDALLDDLGPEEDRRRVRLNGVRHLDALVRSLRGPDGLAAEQWLMGGRRSLPVIGLPDGDESFTRTATAAFNHWAEEFLAHNDAEEIDAIYGSGDDQSDEAESPEIEQPLPGSDKPRLRAVPAQPLTATPWVMKPMPMHVDSRGAPPPWTLSGVFDEQGTEGEVDWYQLSAPAKTIQGAESKALTVTLRLDQARWAGRRKLLVELHPRRRLPLLVPLGDVD